MNTTFVLADLSDSTIDTDGCTDRIIVVNGHSSDKTSDFSEISPEKPLAKANLFLWTVFNGFRMLPSCDSIIIKSANHHIRNDNIQDVLNFVYFGEKHSSLGLIDFSEKQDVKTNSLYAESSSFSLDCVLVTRRLYERLSEMLDDSVMDSDLTESDVVGAIARTELRTLVLKGQANERK